jgi:hypothetical protein
METSLAWLNNAIVKGIPKDTGTAANSFQSMITGSGANIGGEIRSPLVQAVVMEIGRKPHSKMPPVAAIEWWAERHGMKGMGFVIARSIARKGIKGRKYADKAHKDNRPKITRLFDQAVSSVVKAV